MNAADHRRLTPVLLMACALLAGGVVVVAAGVGSGVDWGVATPQAEPAAVTTAAAPPVRMQPLSQYAAVWEKPLFNPDRKPSLESGGNARVSIGDLELTGIMLTPEVRVALLHDRRSGSDVRVREGETLPDSAWALRKLQPRGAVFEQGGQRIELVLKVPEVPPAGGEPEPQQVPAPDKMGKGAGRSMAPATSGAIPLRPPGKNPSAPAFQDNAPQRRARLQALKARIEERRRQTQAGKHGDR